MDDLKIRNNERYQGGHSELKIRIGSLFLFLALLFGCSTSPNSSPPPTDGVISIRGRENPPTLDPAHATGTFDGHLSCLVHGGLVRADPSGEILPELAVSWKVLENGKSYAFELIPSLTFPSGTPFDATSVVESWTRICLPSTGSGVSWTFEDVQGYREVVAGNSTHLTGLRVLSATELRIELEEPSATFLARLTMPAARVVDMHRVQELGDQYGRNPKGLGAWELVEWEDDSHLLFRPNPGYPDHNSKLKGLRFDLVSKDFSASARFETGSLHILNPLPSSQIDYWENFPKWRERMRHSSQFNLYYLGFGCHRTPFDDPRVRVAISKAIDVDKIRTVLFGQRATLAFGPIPPGLLGSETGMVAKGALSASEETLIDGIAFEMWYPDVDPVAALVMEGIQADLMRFGVKCRLRRVDRTAFTSWRREGRFDVFFGNWWADFPDPDNFVTPLFVSDSDSNMTRFGDSLLDDLATQARRELDRETRKKLYKQMVSRIRAETPMVFLWHLNQEALTQPWVSGYEPPSLFQGTLYLDLGIRP